MKSRLVIPGTTHPPILSLPVVPISVHLPSGPAGCRGLVSFCRISNYLGTIGTGTLFFSFFGGLIPTYQGWQ